MGHSFWLLKIINTLSTMGFVGYSSIMINKFLKKYISLDFNNIVNKILTNKKKDL